MATAKHARRMDVLNKAHLHDWEVQSDVFDNGNILRDVFTSELGIVRVVWLRTPWSDSGRYSGALFSEAKTNQDRNIWNVEGSKNSLLGLLASKTPDNKTPDK